MKKLFRRTFYIFLFFGLAFFSFNPVQINAQEVDRSVETHKLTVKKTGNKWKTFDKKKNVEKQPKVKRGDYVVWEADSSDVYFQFMDEKLFGTFNAFLKQGDTLRLEVGKKAKKGKNYYSAFIYNDKAYLEGSSPPQIVVD